MQLIWTARILYIRQNSKTMRLGAFRIIWSAFDSMFYYKLEMNRSSSCFFWYEMIFWGKLQKKKKLFNA